MRYAGFLILALAGCASVPKPDDGSVQITVTAEEAQQCLLAGGCGLVTKAQAANIQFQGYMHGQKEAAADFASRLDSHGCVKGDI
jgi:uncharacterized protein YceK